MKQTHPTYLSLVIATHREADDCTAPTIVTGFGMFKVHKLDRDYWRFSLSASVADTLGDEAALLTRMADTLPQPDFLVGGHIERCLFAPLLQAVDRIPPPVGAYLGMRVARLRLALPVDVALGWARRSATLPYAEPAPITPPIAVELVAGKIVNQDDAVARLEARAIDNWLRFLRQPGSPRVNTAMVPTLTWAAAQGWKI
jgi:hypothetical protein